MPQEHSKLFNDYAEKQLDSNKDREISPIKLEASGLKDYIKADDFNLPDGSANGKSSYDQLADLLREVNDAQFGIVSSLNENNEWVRDATASLPLDQRISHAHPAIEGNNALLRCLSRLRAIDHAIHQKYQEKPPGNSIRADLKDKLAILTEKMISAGQEKDAKTALEQIKQLEQDFDTDLIDALHQANLTKGVTTADEAKKLLFHYRNLSSLIIPARTMVTLTYDNVAHVVQRETQYPVTKKTDTQRKAIDQLRDLNPHPLKQDKNAHTSQRLAMQEADALFVDLMLKDTRALPAQTRKTHLVGAKNAFIVKNELKFLSEGEEIPDDWQAEKGNILWLARTGVPVYVGKGESSDQVQIHTLENLEQIKIAAQHHMAAEEKPKIHITTLNTDTPLENQSQMISQLYKATRQNTANEDNISYTPTNTDGTFRFVDVAPELYEGEKNKRRPIGSAPLNKKWRVSTVADVMLQAAKWGFLSVVNCASGQDRTGTAVEKATQEWMKEQYEKLPTDNIETMRAQGSNAAEITTHHVHGSPGMKEESQASSTFSPEASKQFYRKSAMTNKKNPIGHVDFLKIPSKQAVNEFLLNRRAFLKKLNEAEPKDQPLLQQANKVLAEVNKITKGSEDVAAIQANIDSKSLADLNDVMLYCKQGLEPNPDPTEHTKNAQKLAGLSQVVSGKPSKKWKLLGGALLTFAALSLVAVGVLAAIPTGGSSLVLAAIGAAGAAAVSATAGGSALYYSRQKGLANAVGMFKSVQKETKDEDTPEQSSDIKLGK